MSLTATLDKPSMMAGEPLWMNVSFRRASAVKKPVTIEVAWLSRNRLGRPDNYRVTVTDARGLTLPVLDAGPQMGGMSGSTVLSDQAPTSTRRLLLANWARLPAPGSYTIKVSTTIRVRDIAVGTVGAAGAWRDVPLEATMTVVATSDAPTTYGRLIATWGAQALAGGDDAREALRSIERLERADPRVVPHLVALAAKPGYSQKMTAARLLARFADDRALATILAVGATQPTDLDAARYSTEALRAQSAGQLRVTAANALSESAHPKALSHLLAMSSDPDASVRLTVLHRVARLAEPRRTELVTGFAEDASTMVANEALRYLREGLKR